MIDILKHHQQYVPTKEYAKLLLVPGSNEFVMKESAVINHILFGGDQMTVVRARSAMTAMCNSVTPEKRLEGTIPVIEDWHALVILLGVSSSIM